MAKFGTRAMSHEAATRPSFDTSRMSAPPGLTFTSEDRDDSSDEEEAAAAESTILEKDASAKFCQQRAVFSRFVGRQTHAIAEREKHQSKEHGAQGDSLSLSDIMATTESKRIIESPRDYQMELFEKAKAQNTIAVLDTGSGKTLIAVMLIRHVIAEELQRREEGRPNRIAFFLVPKVVLVFQQYAVLEANLDSPLERLCGDGRSLLCDKTYWHKQIDNSMVIVCTPDCLLHALHRSFIRMDQINLLIFDEAHHAKKDHPYANIIKEYYVTQKDHSKRPRIFGTTASPVDAAVGDKIIRQASELENLLHSKITTASDMALLQKAVHRPSESVLLYRTLPSCAPPPLHSKLLAGFHNHPSFQKLFAESKELTHVLGAWCAEEYWKHNLSEMEQEKRRNSISKKFNQRSSGPIELLDKELEKLKRASEIAANHRFEAPSSRNLSSKVLLLRQELLRRFERPTDIRCLIFVERRATAKLLDTLFNIEGVGTPHMKVGTLLGIGGGAYLGGSSSYREQVVTMLKFRNGELNCLFATSVAEEGVDIPDCSLVIRFDPCRTIIQYIQSRGRARHKNSDFLHMFERGNLEHGELSGMIQGAQGVMDGLYAALPQDRLLTGHDHDFRGDDQDLRLGYTIEASGARLTYAFSLLLLSHFVSCIPCAPEDDMTVIYSIFSENGKFRCEVILPEKSPIKSAMGRAYSRKSIAKRAAAFQACHELLKAGYLDQNLRPIYQKQLPALRSAKLALASKKSDAYEVVRKPTFWYQNLGVDPSSLYLTIVSLRDTWDRPVEPLGLLTRQPLPETPEFPIFRQKGDRCRVIIQSSSSMMVISRDQLDSATDFTLRIFKDVFNKIFEKDDANMWYWIVPVIATRYGSMDLQVDWQHLKSIKDLQSLKWVSGTRDEEVLSKYLIDPYHGGKRYFTEEVARGMRPDDPLPSFVEGEGFRTGTETSILNYTVSLYRKTREGFADKWSRLQPVLKGQRTTHRLNVLAAPTIEESQVKTEVFICPEPLQISRLKVEVVSMMLVMPAILHRLDSYLIAKDCTESLGLGIHLDLALEALTKDSDNQEDHEETKINFQRGMGHNYERLEFIGDTFLKMATSIATYIGYASSDQFAMHCDRMLLLCNKTLFETAERHDYQRYIRGLAFSRRTWYPEGIKLLQGKGKGDSVKQYLPLSKKSIADVCEAYIGAAFITHVRTHVWHETDFDLPVEAVKLFTESPSFPMKTWDEFRQIYNANVPSYQTAPVAAVQNQLAKQVATEHPYEFKWARLVASAFKHPTSQRYIDGLPSYERLEFLGDSLIDMACVTHLYLTFPNKDPHWLTEHKMPMVSNLFLGALCVKLGFHRHMQYSSPAMMSAITSWVTEVKEAEFNSNGARDYWQALREPPKSLPDIVESYVGALFVDSNFDYREVRRFFDMHIKWFFEDMSLYDTFAGKHPINSLRKRLEEELGCKDYKLMAEETLGDDGMTKGGKVIAGLIIHDIPVEEALGVASSVKNAKVQAAVEAFRCLEGLAPSQFRQKYRCNCESLRQSGDMLA